MPVATTVNAAVCPAVTVRLVGCVVIEGATADVVEPTPVSEIVCGLLEALSVRVSVPVRVPAAVGVNFTLIVQLVPGATELPQVPNPSKAKSPLKAALNVRVALPVLVIVVNCAPLLVPTTCVPKVNEVAEKLTVVAVTALARAGAPNKNHPRLRITRLKHVTFIFPIVFISLPFQTCIRHPGKCRLACSCGFLRHTVWLFLLELSGNAGRSGWRLLRHIRSKGLQVKQQPLIPEKIHRAASSRNKFERTDIKTTALRAWGAVVVDGNVEQRQPHIYGRAA